MKCQMPVPPKVMSFERFKAGCLARQSRKCRWGKKLLFYECEDCACGRAVAVGKLTKLPDNVELVACGVSG